ncbi:carbohydrate-binding protein [Pelomyxa schiedti]|nr:carbohydrate-binding protein [Pelomyxa schiedti]
MALWAVLIFFVLVLGACCYDTLNGKLMVGYQGWFATNYSGMNWAHWSSNGQAPEPGTSLVFDLWPDVSEYANLYQTDLHFNSGLQAELFTAYDYQTVDTHFKWMMEYGIDGAFLQRFVCELTNPTTLAFRNQVLFNVKQAAEKYNVTFTVMYDVSGADSTMFQVMMDDWAWLVAEGITTSSAYQYHNDRPVVTIWGFGFNDRTIDHDSALDLVHWFRNQQTVPMGGVPYYWRTGDHDSWPGWEDVYDAFEIISPWAVGRYDSNAAFDKLLRTQVAGDVEYLHGKADYAPVIFPGFSWANLQNDPSIYNQIPRNCGQFFKYQGNQLLGIEHLFLYVAMFDEVNEGTAIFKAATTQSSTPSDAKFLYLDVDGCTMNTDDYLVYAGQLSQA